MMKTQQNQEYLLRADIISKLIEGHITRAQAAQILNLTLRRVDQLKRSYKDQGPAALTPKPTERKRHRLYQEDEKQRFLEVIQEKFAGFGPTFIRYQLCKMFCERIPCKETLRQWMIAAHLHQADRKQEPTIHRLRERRTHYGSLIQMDGSYHDWLGNGDKMTLLVMIDDATSQLQALRFFKQESTDAYFLMMQQYLTAHGKPEALYADRHAVFSVNREDTGSKNFVTSFHQAMTDLQIELILARTPQAKGRVERVNRTLQDRLVKELRLNKIETIEQANAYLPTYINEHNQLFAVTPLQEENHHRPMLQQELTALKHILSKRAHRSVSKSLTVDFLGVTYQLLEESKIHRLRSEGVQCCLQMDGSVAILNRHGKPLAYRRVKVKNKAPRVMSKKACEQREHDLAMNFCLSQPKQKLA
jgi:transposase